MSQIPFNQSAFPNIFLNDAAPYKNGDLWPLCDLKNNGSCQDINLVRIDREKPQNGYYWETEPKINGCLIDCSYYKQKER